MHLFVSACFDLSHSVCAYITFGGWLLCKAVVSWVLLPPGCVFMVTCRYRQKHVKDDPVVAVNMAAQGAVQQLSGCYAATV